MRHSILLFLIFLVTRGFAQNLPQLQLLGEPELATDELVGVRDVNGRDCAAVQILTDLSGLAYDAYNGVVRVDHHPGKDMVFLSPDERVLEILHSGHEPLKLILSEIGIHLKGRQVWRIRLTGEQKLTQIPIVVISDPAGAEISIDGRNMGTGRQLTVPSGSHELRLVKEGFQPVIRRIQVDASQTLFEVKMEKQQEVPLQIDSQPGGAAIYLDDVKVGETPYSYFYPAGRYRLRLEKAWYVTYEDLIDIQMPKAAQTIRLQENFASLTVASSPKSGMDILLDGVPQNAVTPHTFDRLRPGTYGVRAQSAEYETDTQAIDLARGDKKTVQLTSSANFAELTVLTHSAAKVKIDGKEIKTLENIRLAPSVVTVRAEMAKASPVEERLVLRKGEKRTVELYPQVPTGTIQVAVVPFDAKVELRGDAGESFSSVGARSFSDVPVGNYTLKVSLSGYADKQETLVLNEGEKLTRSVTLEKAVAVVSQKTTAVLATKTVTDIDGNVYKTVRIGNQVWMAENLKVKHYRNGDTIPNITGDSQWSNLSSGAWCYYGSRTSNGSTYGCLYNWYAVNDSRGLAPAGWRIPSDADWKQLEMYLGMSRSAADADGWRGTDEGGKLKETGTSRWDTPNKGATDAFGFRALPGGCRDYYNGHYVILGNNAYFWSSSENSSDDAWFRSLYTSYSNINRGSHNKRYGFSVRCVRDN